MALCGGLSPVKEATEEVHDVCNKIREELEKKVGKKFPHFKATHFRTQVVAGTNFFVKIDVGDGKYVHVRIYRPLPAQGDVSVTEYKLDKTADDSIEYFG